MCWWRGEIKKQDGGNIYVGMGIKCFKCLLSRDGGGGVVNKIFFYLLLSFGLCLFLLLLLTYYYFVCLFFKTQNLVLVLI